MSDEKNRLSFHHGQVLMRLSATYPRLLDAALEMIQNAIDGGASNVYLEFDLAAKNRSAMIADNGSGISPEKFSQALSSVGMSIKDRAPGTLGQFGLGLVSPLGKVTKLRVASFVEGQPVHEWVFNPKTICEMAEAVDIPSRRVPRFPMPKGVWDGVDDWKTCIRLEGIHTDRTTSAISVEELRDKVQSNFGEVMRRRDIAIKVKIKRKDGEIVEEILTAKAYKGTPFDITVYEEPDAGDVTITLYRALARPGTKPSGKVSIRSSSSLFAVTWNDFARQVRGRGYSGPWSEALGSGFFEGEIVAENIELEPERNLFVFNDALVGFYACLEKWFELEGKPYVDKARVEHNNDRLQILGLKSMDRVREWMDQPGNEAMAQAFRDIFEFGTIGRGHNTPTSGKPGEEDEEKVARDTHKSSSGGSGGESGGGKPDEEGSDNPDDVPTGVQGPRGQRRQRIKGDSQGLILVHEPLDTLHLWELDMDLGKLYFNTSHALWAKCESKDPWVLHLQDWILMQVIRLLMSPQELFQTLREFSDGQAAFYVDEFIIRGHGK